MPGLCSGISFLFFVLCLCVFYYKLCRGTAALLEVDFPACNEGLLLTFLVMTDGVKLEVFVVFYAEHLAQRFHQGFALGIIVVEAEGEHEGRGLHHVGMDAELVADFENRLQVVLVHEGEVAWRNAHQGLVVFYNVMGDG